MSNSATPEALRAWFRPVQPLCVELFNVAHLICGSNDLAEYALRCALLDVWLERASLGMGFRERLRACLRQEAIDLALSDEGRSAECTWALPADASDDGLVGALLARESLQTQRLVLLCRGCGLSPRVIARLTGVSAAQVRAEVGRFEERCRQRLASLSRTRADAMITRQARKLLARSVADAPRISQIYRAFEAEAGGTQVNGRRLSHIVGNIFLVLAALFCAGAFWLFAVLISAEG